MGRVVLAGRRVEDVLVFLAFDDEIAGKAALGSREGMIDEDVTSGHLEVNSTMLAEPGGTKMLWTFSMGGW